MRTTFAVAALFAAASANEFLNEPQIYVAEPIVGTWTISNIAYEITSPKSTFYLGKTSFTPMVHTPINILSPYTTLRDNEVSLAAEGDITAWVSSNKQLNETYPFPNGSGSSLGAQSGSWKTSTLSLTENATEATANDFPIFISKVGQFDLRSPWIGLAPHTLLGEDFGDDDDDEKTLQKADLALQQRSSYLWQLKNQKIINHETISFNFPNDNFYEIFLGATTLNTKEGSINAKFDVKDYNELLEGEEFHWGLTIKSMKFYYAGEEVLPPEEEITYEVKIGNSLFITLPSLFFNAVSEKFGAAGFQYANGVYYSENTCEYFKQLDAITLHLDGYIFNIPASVYLNNATGIIHQGISVTNYKCVAALFETIKNEVTLGYTFYKNYAVLLDNEKLEVTVGVSPNAVLGTEIKLGALAGLAASVFGVFGIAALAL